MILKKKSLSVLVAYNTFQSKNPVYNPDRISEKAVMEQAEQVFLALDKLNWNPHYLPVSDIYQDIQLIQKLKPDVIFNLCEGYSGNSEHEMHVAGLWELLNIPYTGNRSLTLGISQNKVLTKRLFESRRIHTPPYQVYKKIPDMTFLKYPLIAKPSREDASLGITQQSVVHDLTGLKRIVQSLLEKYKQPILVEEFIEGREFNISIMGNEKPRVLAISEIKFTGIKKQDNHITSYEAKWLKTHPMYQKTPVICPANIDKNLKDRLEDVALQVYTLLIGRDYGRVDIRVDSSGKIYVLEYNPNPDISADAGFPRALKAAGISYSEFVEFMVNQALERG